uniref:Uncharacterized protein n=1 Tax=Aegilops tauschii subsp. strangulata TaxID=200361 RepID=A0A453P3F5_AEGTS
MFHYFNNREEDIWSLSKQSFLIGVPQFFSHKK